MRYSLRHQPGAKLFPMTDFNTNPERFLAKHQTRCPECGATSGDSWGQCSDRCPMPMSPHHDTSLGMRAEDVS